MSGVYGAIDGREPGRVPELVARMGASLRHHAWHVTDDTCDVRLGAGLGRMRGGVFNAAPQPLRSSDGRFTLCFAGELYNRDVLCTPLRDGGRVGADADDSMLVLELYRDCGVETPGRLDGMFSFAVWDGDRRELFIAADRFGSYPLYYCRRPGRFLFAPEIKAILCDAALSPRLDLAALAEYVRFQHLLGEKTFFADISLLPNGGWLLYRAGDDTVHDRIYWDASHVAALPENLRLEEAAEEAGGRLRDAVRQRAHGPGRVGVYLSGGLDSRALLGFLAQHAGTVDTFTYGTQGCRDVVYAARMAALVAARHRYAPFTDGNWVRDYAALHLELTEGFHSWIHAHGISVLDQAREVMDINLSGFRGGHLGIFWGDMSVIDAMDDVELSMGLFRVLLRQATWPGLDEGEAAMLLRSDFGGQLRDLAFASLQHEVGRLAGMTPVQRASQFDVSNPGRRLYQYLVTFHRSRIEQRLPFCDYRYTEFVYALPPRLNIGRDLRRAILRRYLPHLCSVPYDKDDLPVARSEVGRLAAKARRRATSFFNRAVRPIFPEYATLNADYDAWLRGELRDWGHDLLLGPSARRRALFDRESVEALWRRQQSGHEPNFVGKIASLMSLELIFRRFVD